MPVTWRPLRTGLTLLLALSLAAAAQAAGPFGGTVTSLALGPDGRTPAWAATSRGLFRYESDRWSRVERLEQKDLRVVVALPDRLVVAPSMGALLISEDRGESWRRSSEGLRGRYGHRVDDIRTVVGDPEDPLVLHLGAAGQGLFESRDAGRTWALLLAGLENARPQAFHPQAILPPAGARPMLMGTDGAGLFAWEDGAWSSFGEGLPERLRVQRLADDPSDPQHVALGSRGHGLWETRDGGRTWKQRYKGRFGVVAAVSVSQQGEVLAHLPEEGLVRFGEGKPQRTRQLASAQVRVLLLRRGGGWLAGLTDDGVAEVSSETQLVGALNAGLDASRVLALAAGPAGSTIWAGDANGVFSSAGGKGEWVSRDQGLRDAPVNAFLWRRGQLYLGAGGNGVHRWAPDSESWKARSGGLGTANTIYSLVENPSTGRLFVGTEGGVLRSDDDGGLWVRKNQGLPGASRWVVETSKAVGGRVWAAGGGELFRSDDAGETWQVIAEARPVALHAVGGAENERLWVLEAGRLFVLDGIEPGSAVLKARTGERFNCVLIGADTSWVGSSRGLWAVARGEAELAWGKAGVLSLLALPDGSLLAGTDGRGVARIESR